MKIKAVCELTGLSDRAVRYYIQRELIAPAYTENYLGRRAYDFTQGDVDALNHIAILRGFDFSIEEIHTLLRDAGQCPAVLSAVRARAAQAAAQGQRRLAALARVDDGRARTVSELAEALSAQPEELPAVSEEMRAGHGLGDMVRGVLTFLTVWAPIGVSGLFLVLALMDYHWPVFDAVCLWLLAAALLPSLLMLTLSRRLRRKWVRRLLLALCAVSIPVCFLLSLGGIAGSQTAELHNYRKFDPNCLAGRDVLEANLFPAQPRYGDGARYDYAYRSGFFDTCHVFAQWSLAPEAFEAEMARASAVLENASRVHHGSYDCLILFDPPGAEPFGPLAADRTCLIYIFAWDPRTHTLRYLFEQADPRAAQPYYLTLDWN